MGWTSYRADHYKWSGKSRIVDRKAECDAYFMEGLNKGHFEVLKSAMVGTTYYAAVKSLKKAITDEQGNFKYVDLSENEQEVWAAIFLTSTDMKDYYNFSYKDMDETCGPCYNECPVGILKLLTPTESKNANDWRNACLEYHKKKKEDVNDISKLRVGSKVKFIANGREYIMRKEYGCAYLMNGKLKKISTRWTNGIANATTKCIKSWGYEVIHAATKEEEAILRKQKLESVGVTV